MVRKVGEQIDIVISRSSDNYICVGVDLKRVKTHQGKNLLYNHIVDLVTQSDNHTHTQASPPPPSCPVDAVAEEKRDLRPRHPSSYLREGGVE